MNWGRFTARGGPAVEARVTAAVAEVAAAVREVVDPMDYRAFVMLGDYGRGEGGVEVVDGEERAHNNFDFLLVANSASPARHAALEHGVDAAIQPLARRHGIGMDASVTSVRTLRRSPCLVIWYDMRFGHKTILGDQDFVPGLARYRVDRVLPADVRNLLVNRGTLLVINDMLLERGDLGEAERRTVVKHAVKAVIGYGDALLYFHGRYDWSHQEKQRRMAATRDVDPAFRALYDECMEFRFKPDYPRYLAQDLGAWMDDLRAMVQPVHLACERLRLGEPDLEWADYADHAFAHAVFQDPFSARAWARKAKGFLKGAASPTWLPGVARLGLRVSRPRGVFPVLFPLIAYDLDAARFRTLARDVLGAGAEDAGSLRRAYLKQWGVFGDENFPAVLRKLGIDLDARARAEVLA